MENRPAETMKEEIERLERFCDFKVEELFDRDSKKRAAKMMNLKTDLKGQKRQYGDGEYDVIQELEGLAAWTDHMVAAEVEEAEDFIELARIADLGKHIRARLINYRDS